MIERAQQEWLRARERWKHCPDEAASAAYHTADWALFAAFADGWDADMRTVSSAYRAFRTLLAEQCVPEPLRFKARGISDLPAL